jgi:hypothetical protein
MDKQDVDVDTTEIAETRSEAEGKGAKSEAREPKVEKPSRVASKEVEAEDDGEESTGSLLDDAGEGPEDTKPDTPATWPQDWREKFAGNDEKLLKRLARFASPENFVKSYKALEQKLNEKSSVKPPEDEEKLAKWREEQGVPKEAADYKIPKIKNHEWTAADEPIIGDFLVDLHNANAPQPIVDAALGWYAKFAQQQHQAVYDLDVSDKETLEDAMRSEWGGEYRGNINLMKRVLEHDLPKGLGDALANARMADGHRLINHPEFPAWLVGLGKEIHGDEIVRGDGKPTTAGDRLAEISNILATDAQRYWREKLDEEAIVLRRQLEKSGGKGKRAA